MDYPMKVYGLNLLETFLGRCISFVAMLLTASSVALLLWHENLSISSPYSAAGAVAMVGTSILFTLGGGGIRQNRAAMDCGFGLLALMSLGWCIFGAVKLNLYAASAGFILVVIFIGLCYLRLQAVKARFNPRFFSLRQFETLVQIADTMIDTDGNEALNSIEVAIRIDRLMANVDSPATAQIRLVMVLTEWLLPLLVLGTPLPFSDLGSNERRRTIETLIKPGGLWRKLTTKIFHDVARTFKFLFCAGYYGSPEGMAQSGFVPFEQRPQYSGLDHSPRHYPDPFTKERNL